MIPSFGEEVGRSSATQHRKQLPETERKRDVGDVGSCGTDTSQIHSRLQTLTTTAKHEVLTGRGHPHPVGWAQGAAASCPELLVREQGFPEAIHLQAVQRIPEPVPTLDRHHL